MTQWFNPSEAPDRTPALVAIKRNYAPLPPGSTALPFAGNRLVLKRLKEEAAWTTPYVASALRIPDTWVAGWQLMDDHPDDMAPRGLELVGTYRNYRGIIAERRILPTGLRLGTTDWHPEPGWLLEAVDTEKNARREFALADFDFLSHSDEHS